MSTICSNNHLRWNQFIVYLVVVAIAVASVVYTNVSQSRSERKFCAVITTITDAYRNSPDQPTTELGRNLKAKYFQLEKDLHCVEGGD